MERASLSVEWLEQARIERGWTQEYVAEQVGVEPKTVRRWEHGLYQPRPQHSYRLCKLFGREFPPIFQEEDSALPPGEGTEMQAPIGERDGLP